MFRERQKLCKQKCLKLGTSMWIFCYWIWILIRPLCCCLAVMRWHINPCSHQDRMVRRGRDWENQGLEETWTCAWYGPWQCLVGGAACSFERWAEWRKIPKKKKWSTLWAFCDISVLTQLYVKLQNVCMYLCWFIFMLRSVNWLFHKGRTHIFSLASRENNSLLFILMNLEEFHRVFSQILCLYEMVHHHFTPYKLMPVFVAGDMALMTNHLSPVPELPRDGKFFLGLDCSFSVMCTLQVSWPKPVRCLCMQILYPS